METEETTLNEKSNNNYECLKCIFKCCYLSDWKRHISTNKHKNEHDKNPIKINYECYCGKSFISNSGLWKHKKKCLLFNKKLTEEVNINDKNALVIYLLKQNTELQYKIINMTSS
jgi:hypothetical protein